MIDLFCSQILNAVFGQLIENKSACKKRRLVVAQNELYVVLIHQPVKHRHAAVTVAINDVAQYVKEIALSETCLFQELLEPFKRV